MNSAQKNKVKEIETNKKSLLDSTGNISLNKILHSDKCLTIINECREFRDRIYTPFVTIFMFIKQVLNPDKSCRNAVSGAVAEEIFSDGSPSSTSTGPYCKARARLPEETLHDLVRETGKSATSAVPLGWRWNGRPVKLADGTTVTMTDTEENQAEFPQHGNQKEGIGFPIARLVAVMSLDSGTVIDYAIAAHKGKGTGEHSLLRRIMDSIDAGDIFLGDCYYPSFF